MNFPSPTEKLKSSVYGAHDSEAEFELLDDDDADFGLSQLQLNGHHERSSYDALKSIPVQSDVVEDAKAIRALRQDILSKYNSNESRNLPLPVQVKIFFTSRLRPYLTVLQSDDGVVEHDFSPNTVRVPPESLIFWNKSTARRSSGFFIQPQRSDGEHEAPNNPSDSQRASLESNTQEIELFTHSNDSDALIYWGTMQILPDALPDLHELEFRALPRQTQKVFYHEAVQHSEANLAVDAFGSFLSVPGHKIKCIGFRRIGFDSDLTGKFGWSRQKLSPDARQYLLTRRADLDLVPIADIPKTARRIRRLPKALKAQPPGTGSSPLNPPTTRLKFKATDVPPSARPSDIQSLADDLDALDFEPPIFRASKRKRDERATITTTEDCDDVSPSKKAREFRKAVSGEAADITLEQKFRRKERKMKKSRARRKQNKEIGKIAAVLDGLSIGQLDSDEDGGMEELKT